jgi:ABC-type branched-subunit amino acid transport system substrate-binding protein
MTTVWGQDYVKLLTQLKEFNASNYFDIIYNPWYTVDLGSVVVESDLAFYSTALYSNKIDNELNQSFMNNYKSEYGSPPPSGWGGMFYSSIRQSFQVIEEQGSTDKDALVDGLEGRTYDAVQGGQGQFRTCDHQQFADQFIVKARESKADKNHENDFVEVVQRLNGEDVVHDCRSSCNL